MSDDQRQQFVQQLPPDVQGQLDPNDPQAMAQGFQQAAQQRPDLLEGIKDHPVASVAVAGLAAVAAKHLWDQHQQTGGI